MYSTFERIIPRTIFGRAFFGRAFYKNFMMKSFEKKNPHVFEHARELPDTRGHYEGGFFKNKNGRASGGREKLRSFCVHFYFGHKQHGLLISLLPAVELNFLLNSKRE